MFNILRSILRAKQPPVATFTAEIAPARVLYVIGDIHGRNDLLGQLLDKIRKDAGDRSFDLVTVGDYVDRGDNSAAVLSQLNILSQETNVTSLMGNHERMLLDFLDDPARNGRRWIRNGGLQTLASFGVGGLTETAGSDAMSRVRDTFLGALGTLEPWIRALPLSFQSGNVAVVHAGADPRLAISEQLAKNLIWGHPDFFKVARTDDLWIVHGHTIVDTPGAHEGRVSVDTGAYATGRLTAAVIGKKSIRFLRNP